MHVLVHIDLDQGLGPIGAWGKSRYGLKHFYPESLDTAISARARNLMAQRDLDVDVEDWMDLIADSAESRLDRFAILETPDDEPLPIVLAEFRKTYLEETASD